MPPRPAGPDDLLARSRMIEVGTAHAGLIPPLIKEIGTDALFALQRTLHGEALERVKADVRDLALAFPLYPMPAHARG